MALNQWFSHKERGTLYGIWFSAHNIGTGLTYVITAVIVVRIMGGGWGCWRRGAQVASGFLYHFMFDRPQTYGLPPVTAFTRGTEHGGPGGGESAIVGATGRVETARGLDLGLASAAC